jgi:hypothetical protein
MTSLLKLFICFTTAFALIALLSIEKTYALNCDLRKEVERHQRLDNFIDQKFDHYWYGTRPTPNYRARNLGEIVAYLPGKTALLFYTTSDEPDVGELYGTCCPWTTSWNGNGPSEVNATESSGG